MVMMSPLFLLSLRNIEDLSYERMFGIRYCVNEGAPEAVILTSRSRLSGRAAMFPRYCKDFTRCGRSRRGCVKSHVNEPFGMNSWYFL